jgi:hypothetical protein
MAGNTQMNDNERGLFSLVHGIGGGLIATVLLLSILAFLTINSFAVQKENATNFYSVNQDINGLKTVAPSSEQYKNYTDAK